MKNHKADKREELIQAIIDAKREDPEIGSFTEWLADCLIAHGWNSCQWVSVADRRPTAPGEYIVKIAYASATTALWYNPAEDVWFSDDARDQYPVTHWMEMPEIPKED